MLGVIRGGGMTKGASGYENRVELVVDGKIFWSRVHGMNVNDELRWLGLEPFDS